MNHYLKLVQFEVQRFFKLFVFLVATVVTAQLIGATISSFSYVNRAQTTMQKEKLLASDYTLQYGAYSIQHFIYSGFFQLSIMFAVAVLIIYVFFIWYRDWLGKSSFIYRLLMLPTERRNIYFAKLTTILLFVLCIVGLQVVILEVVSQIIQWIVPEALRVDRSVSITYSYDVLSILYPQTLLQFALHYGVGITIVAIMFTAILFERSYRLKGIFIAGIYLLISGAILIAPLIITSFTNYFYRQEIIMMTIFTSILALVLAIFTANYLLKQKINV